MLTFWRKIIKVKKLNQILCYPMLRDCRYCWGLSRLLRQVCGSKNLLCDHFFIKSVTFFYVCTFKVVHSIYFNRNWRSLKLRKIQSGGVFKRSKRSILSSQNQRPRALRHFLLEYLHLPGLWVLLTEEEVIFLCCSFLKQYINNWKRRQTARNVGWTELPGLSSKDSYSSCPP